MNGQLASLMEAMEDTKTNIDSLQKKNKKQDSTIAKQGSTIAKQGSTIAKQDSTIAKQDSTIAKQGSTIDGQVATITQHSAAIERLEAQNEVQEGVNEDLKTELRQEKAGRKEDVECLIQVFHFVVLPLP